MVDKKRSAPLKGQRGGRYLELKHSSSIVKRKLASGFASPSSAVSYKGVRMRAWGKWVTETRDPVTKTRIWLGSFATAEMAARAYDAAVVCLKGASAPEVNFPDSIPSFVVPQCNSSPKEIQAVALAAATASVPWAAPLAMAAPPQLPNPPREESREALVEVTPDREFCRGGGANDDGTSNCGVPEPESSISSSMEDWIINDFEELDALDNQDDFMGPLQRQISDSMEQLFRPWPLLSEDFEDAADCWMTHQDVQLWSFA
jgi:EREBP-like factor